MTTTNVFALAPSTKADALNEAGRVALRRAARSLPAPFALLAAQAIHDCAEGRGEKEAAERIADELDEMEYFPVGAVILLLRHEQLWPWPDKDAATRDDAKRQWRAKWRTTLIEMGLPGGDVENLMGDDDDDKLIMVKSRLGSKIHLTYARRSRTLCKKSPGEEVTDPDVPPELLCKTCTKNDINNLGDGEDFKTAQESPQNLPS